MQTEFLNINSKYINPGNQISKSTSLAPKQVDNSTLERTPYQDEFSADDGKISTADKAKNFLKGIITPITTMFSSPKNLAIGAASIAGGALLIAATGGAIAPVLVAGGILAGGVQLAANAYKASSAKTDDEARQAWQGIGSGTTAVAGSIIGSKAALKGAGVDTGKMNALSATLECFKQAPKGISNSFKAFSTGAFIKNIKNGLHIKNNKKQEDAKKFEKPQTETQKPGAEVKVEAKPEPKAEAKPEVKAETKVKAKVEPKAEAKGGTKAEVKAEPKAETQNLVAALDDAQIESDFKLKAKETMPKSFEERCTQLTDNGCDYYTARDIAKSDDLYINQMWKMSSEYKNITVKNRLKSLPQEDLERFIKAKNILDKNGIKYNDYDLLMSKNIQKINETLTSKGGNIVDGHGYARGINPDVRTQEHLDGKTELLVQILDKGFENVKPLENPQTVYRGVHAASCMEDDLAFVESIINAKKGSIIPDKGYAYASFDKKIANIYADSTIDGKSARMIIKVPEGAKVSSAQHSTQAEMLFPRNSQFRVLEEAREINGLPEIILEYILPQ